MSESPNLSECTRSLSRQVASQPSQWRDLFLRRDLVLVVIGVDKHFSNIVCSAHLVVIQRPQSLPLPCRCTLGLWTSTCDLGTRSSTVMKGYLSQSSAAQIQGQSEIHTVFAFWRQIAPQGVQPLRKCSPSVLLHNSCLN